MAADQLLGHVARDRAEVTLAALLEQQREEVDLEQHVAELVEQLVVLAQMRSLGELVGLLDGVGDDAALVLRRVPGTVTPQPAGDLLQRHQRFAHGWVRAAAHRDGWRA